MNNKTFAIVIIMLLSAIIFLLFRNNSLKTRANNASQNYEAAIDTIRQYRLENHQLLYSKKSYMLEKRDLMDQLDISKQEYKDLENALNSKIARISRVKSKVVVDTVYVPGVVVDRPDTVILNYSLSDEWLRLGFTSYLYNGYTHANIDTLEVNVPLDVITTEDNQISITSKNPYLNITYLESAQVVKYKNKPKRFSLSFQTGAGLQYGFKNGFDLGVYAGVGLSYKFIEF